jgi:hypothetical protein
MSTITGSRSQGTTRVWQSSSGQNADSQLASFSEESTRSCNGVHVSLEAKRVLYYMFHAYPHPVRKTFHTMIVNEVIMHLKYEVE